MQVRLVGCIRLVGNVCAHIMSLTHVFCDATVTAMPYWLKQEARDSLVN